MGSKREFYNLTLEREVGVGNGKSWSEELVLLCPKMDRGSPCDGGWRPPKPARLCTRS